MMSPDPHRLPAWRKSRYGRAIAGRQIPCDAYIDPYRFEEMPRGKTMEEPAP